MTPTLMPLQYPTGEGQETAVEFTIDPEKFHDAFAAEIPEGVASGRHSHPGPEVGYIVRGDVAMAFDDRPTLTLRIGDPFLIPPGVIHNARNIGSVTTKMLSTYVVDEAQPLATSFS